MKKILFLLSFLLPASLMAQTVPFTRVSGRASNDQLPVMATGTIKGNNTGSIGSPGDLTATQVRNLLSILDSTNYYTKGVIDILLGGKQTALGYTPLRPSNNLSDLASASTARTNLGLGNVDNTSDANKPISTATQAALNLKGDSTRSYPKTSIDLFLAGKQGVLGYTPVPNTRQLNGYPLSSNITLTTTDIAEGTRQYFSQPRVRNALLSNYSTNSSAFANGDSIQAFANKAKYQIEKNALEIDAPNIMGVLYNYDFTSSGGISAFTKVGSSATFTPGASGLVVANASQALTDYLYVTGYTSQSADYLIEYDVIAGTINSTSSGIAVGFQSANGSAPLQTSGHILFNLSSTNTGQWQRFLNNSTTLIASSTSKIAVTAGQTIKMRIRVRGNRFDALATNLSTGNQNAWTEWGSGATSHRLAIYAMGGTHTLKNFKVTSLAQKGAELLCIGDSNTAGSGLDRDDDRYFTELGKYLHSKPVQYGGSGARAQEVQACLSDIIAHQPKAVSIMIGTNNYNDYAGFQTAVNAINTSLTGAGITVWWITPPPRTDTDMSSFASYLQTQFGSTGRVIDAFSPFTTLGATTLDANLSDDGVHLNTVAARSLAWLIMNNIYPSIDLKRVDFNERDPIRMVFRNPITSIKYSGNYLNTSSQIVTTIGGTDVFKAGLLGAQVIGSSTTNTTNRALIVTSSTSPATAAGAGSLQIGTDLIQNYSGSAGVDYISASRSKLINGGSGTQRFAAGLVASVAGSAAGATNSYNNVAGVYSEISLTAGSYSASNFTAPFYAAAPKQTGGSINSSGYWAGLYLEDMVASTTTDILTNTASINSGTFNKRYALYSNGGDFFIKGAVGLGITGLTNPAAKLHMVQGTLGTAVTRLESTATTNNVIATLYQNKATTTDATVTTLHTFATTTDVQYTLRATVTAKRTGGASGTAGDGASYIVAVRAKNVGGTVTIGTPVSLLTDEDQVGWDVTFSVSGTNVLVRVTGAASNNISWSLNSLEGNEGNN